MMIIRVFYFLLIYYHKAKVLGSSLGGSWFCPRDALVISAFKGPSDTYRFKLWPMKWETSYFHQVCYAWCNLDPSVSGIEVVAWRSVFELIWEIF